MCCLTQHSVCCFISVDIPLTAIFTEETGNSSQLHEQQEEDKSTERELQENISVREDDNGQEEKKRDKEDGERLVQILVSSLYLGLNKLNGSKQSVY